jgi:hypothetical protein
VARVLVLVDDLMLASKVTETLTSAGHELLPPDRRAEAEAVVADLDAVEPAEVVAIGVPALGFYPHTDTETRQRALNAGFARVVPRSRMARELPELVAGLLD